MKSSSVGINPRSSNGLITFQSAASQPIRRTFLARGSGIKHTASGGVPAGGKVYHGSGGDQGRKHSLACGCSRSNVLQESRTAEKNSGFKIDLESKGLQQFWRNILVILIPQHPLTQLT